MTKKLARISFTILAALIFLAACKKTSMQANGYASTQFGNTATVKMSNGWWVNISLPGLGNLTPTPVFFSTYNTAANSPDSMWLDDLGNGYVFKCVVAVNYPALTFSATNSINIYDSAETVNILNGKVLPKAGHSRAGNITDSLYMQAIFSDDLTDTFTIAGTARTGFDEDDY